MFENSSTEPRIQLSVLESAHKLNEPTTIVRTQLPRPVSQSATNPETSATPIQYSYDPDGNLIKKTDPRCIATSFGYDALSRLGTKQYSDGTAPVTYCYGDG
jgi:YD repeat-containing protein